MLLVYIKNFFLITKKLSVYLIQFIITSLYQILQREANYLTYCLQSTVFLLRPEEIYLSRSCLEQMNI